jgi:predicted lipoprotein with Yx(FWY)xxD motif
MYMSRLFYLSFSGRVSSEAKEKHMLSGHLSLSLTTMRSWRCAFVVATLVVLLAACGSSTSGSGGTTPTTSAAQNTTPTTSSGYGGGKYGSGGTTPTASSSTSLIKTATATVNGTSETILTNSQGLTLYYRTSDMPPSTVCSGGCAGAWPPLVVSGSGAPTSAASLSGKLTVVTDANGKQVEYNGHPLYTYSGDTGPGQTTGEGVGGVWHVCTPSLT